jgi:hypothetical protein
MRCCGYWRVPEAKFNDFHGNSPVCGENICGENYWLILRLLKRERFFECVFISHALPGFGFQMHAALTQQGRSRGEILDFLHTTPHGFSTNCFLGKISW